MDPVLLNVHTVQTGLSLLTKNGSDVRFVKEKETNGRVAICVALEVLQLPVQASLHILLHVYRQPIRQTCVQPIAHNPVQVPVHPLLQSVADNGKA